MEKEDELVLKENIEKQLIEIEILQSIYSNSNEFSLEDQEARLDSQFFLSQDTCDTSLLRRKLGFVIKFSVDSFEQDNTSQLILEIICRLPSTYPLISPPEVFIRCLNRKLNRNFSKELRNFVISSHSYDCSILNIIEWAKDNVHRFTGNTGSDSPPPSVAEKRIPRFSRTFIYSHHIFSVKKRQSIVNWARELDLSGFCMPGKPGIIVAEGDYENVQEYMTRMRNLSWQKIQIKDSLTVEVESKDKMNGLRKFDVFEEKLFSAHNDSNIDLGLLFVFLKEKGFENIFAMYFGVDGKLPSNP